MHACLYSTHVCVAILFFLCRLLLSFLFLSRNSTVLFTSSLSIFPLSPLLNALKCFSFLSFFFSPSSFQIHAYSTRSHLFVSLFVCTQKKCIVCGCGPWCVVVLYWDLDWTCRGMKYPCENPNSNNLACKHVFPVRAPLERLRFKQTTARDYHLL